MLSHSFAWIYNNLFTLVLKDLWIIFELLWINLELILAFLSWASNYEWTCWIKPKCTFKFSNYRQCSKVIFLVFFSARWVNVPISPQASHHLVPSILLGLKFLAGIVLSRCGFNFVSQTVDFVNLLFVFLIIWGQRYSCFLIEFKDILPK
jgi:hypothetical protein